MPAWSAYVAPVLFVAILLAAAISDAMRRKIPNWTVLALVGLYVVAAVLKLTPTDPWWALGAAGIAFVVTYGLYHFDIVGAGDAKLFTAAALFAGMKFLPLFALLTALAGGLYAVGFLLVRPRQAMRGLTAAGRKEGAGMALPYGVPIAMGAAGVAVLNGFLSF